VHRPLRRLLTLTVGPVAVCLAAAACSSGSPSASTSSTTSTTATTVPFNPALNARGDVTLSTCSQVSGAWKAAGTVDNSKTVPRNYVIVVDFVTKPGYTVEDTKNVSVDDVGGRKTVQWSATGAPGKSNLLCVIRTVQAHPA
jgi:hypothetical protein